MDHQFSRRNLVKLGVAGAGVAVLAGGPARVVRAAPPPLEKKDSYVVGFCQVGSNNPWRLAETKSMQDEAEKRGYRLIETNANEDTAKQIADVASVIAQRPDIIIFPPRESTPLAQSVLQAKEAGIPVILIDRDVDHSIAQPNDDYVTFIGSDFVEQGRRAAEWLIKATGGTAAIIQLEGTTGSDPAIDRQRGFEDLIVSGSFMGTPVSTPVAGMQIVASQSADFNRDEGRKVMETLLQAHPDVDAVYAHNDEMALGAIAAIEAAGLVPGEDIILVSIDGSNDALQAIVDGKLGATVESSPFFGPIAFDTMEKYASGEPIPDWVVVEDRFFDSSNAEELLGTQY